MFFLNLNMVRDKVRDKVELRTPPKTFSRRVELRNDTLKCELRRGAGAFGVISVRVDLFAVCNATRHRLKASATISGRATERYTEV